MSQSNLVNTTNDLLFTVCGYLHHRETCLLRVVSRRFIISDRQVDSIHWHQIHPDWSAHQDLVRRAMQLQLMNTHLLACSGCGYINPQDYFYSYDNHERYCTWCTYDTQEVRLTLDDAVYYAELYP
jgi:hypothetical protein